MPQRAWYHSRQIRPTTRRRKGSLHALCRLTHPLNQVAADALCHRLFQLSPEFASDRDDRATLVRLGASDGQKVDATTLHVDLIAVQTEDCPGTLECVQGEEDDAIDRAFVASCDQAGNLILAQEAFTVPGGGQQRDVDMLFDLLVELGPVMRTCG